MSSGDGYEIDTGHWNLICHVANISLTFCIINRSNWVFSRPCYGLILFCKKRPPFQPWSLPLMLFSFIYASVCLSFVFFLGNWLLRNEILSTSFPQNYVSFNNYLFWGTVTICCMVNHIWSRCWRHFFYKMKCVIKLPHTDSAKPESIL